jgi:diamine N-acetyltransferase
MKIHKIELRNVDLDDAHLLLQWENDPENAKFNSEKKNYTYDEIIDLIKSSSKLEKFGQERLMIIESQSRKTIGALDFFELDIKHSMVGAGILIANKDCRGKGYAKEALKLGLNKLKDTEIEKVFCNIDKDNIKSQGLFLKLGFELVNSVDGEAPKYQLPNHLYFELCLKK